VKNFVNILKLPEVELPLLLLYFGKTKVYFFIVTL